MDATVEILYVTGTSSLHRIVNILRHCYKRVKLRKPQNSTYNDEILMLVSVSDRQLLSSAIVTLNSELEREDRESWQRFLQYCNVKYISSYEAALAFACQLHRATVRKEPNKSTVTNTTTNVPTETTTSTSAIPPTGVYHTPPSLIILLGLDNILTNDIETARGVSRTIATTPRAVERYLALLTSATAAWKETCSTSTTSIIAAFLQSGEEVMKKEGNINATTNNLKHVCRKMARRRRWNIVDYERVKDIEP